MLTKVTQMQEDTLGMLFVIYGTLKKITPTVRDREGGRRKTERVDRSVEIGTWTDAITIPMPL